MIFKLYLFIYVHHLFNHYAIFFSGHFAFIKSLFYDISKN